MDAPTMALRKRRFSPAPDARRSWFWRMIRVFALSVLATVLLVALGSVLLGTAPALQLVSRTVETSRPGLHAAQLSALLLLWWKWGAMVDWLCRRDIFPARARAPLLSARHRILVVLLAIQLLVVMELPFRWMTQVQP